MTAYRFLRSLLLAGGVGCLVLAGAGPLHAQSYDTGNAAVPDSYPGTDQDPGRVARLAYLSGQVQFAPAGENDWGSVEINRPMVLGDRLLTGDDGLAVLELGDASLRIDHDSAFDFLNLADNNVQIELSQGTLNLALRQLAYGTNYEVDTPTIAFVASTPGTYRIDNNPDGTGSMVTVFRGSGVVYGENGASREVTAGTSYRFNDSSLANVDVTGLPEPDAFDRFCEARDTSYERYAQQQQEQQYVAPDMIGADQLYEYGQWDAVPDYGHVWYPNTVPTGWAPYRYGRWVWIEPWGWTWVDRQPWGFAPFHYGRWVYIRNRWGWLPGPVDVRPVYAPAMVAFLGGSGLSISLRIGGGHQPVGWFPLGPRDVYVPWFHASHRYFTRVNVTNIRNVYVNKTVINNFYGDYRAGRRPAWGRHDYTYRRLPGAVTAVPRNVFTDARPVHPAVLRLTRSQLTRSEPSVTPGVTPGRGSLGLRHTETRIIDVHGRRPFVRPVVARHQPAPRPLPFSAREKVLATQQGRALSPTQVRDLRQRELNNEPRPERVRLVRGVAGVTAGAAALGPTRHPAPAPRHEPAPRPVNPTTQRGTPTQREFRNTVHPIPALRQPQQQPGELPSARFAHPDRPRSLPQVPVLRPAHEPATNPTPRGRLPVVRPVEPAPRSQARVDRRPSASPDNGAAQHAREAQMQRQRQVETQQAQQRARDAQMQRQRQAETQQAQQRAREAQMQRQRQAEMQQAQQRAREAQMQRQRQAELQQAQQRARQQQMQRQAEARQAEQQRSREHYTPRQPPPRRAPPPSSNKHPSDDKIHEPRIR